MKFEQETIAVIRKNLLKWFQKNQRDLPWRKTYDPYQVWISEIMLQQTQVATVLPYFDRWMKKLPSIESVANADDDKILKLWEGLGYYSRARNIQKAARLIVRDYDGIFPNRYEGISKLPGIGRYTAGAIASIAFNQDHPIVDGNVIRLLARLNDFHKNTRLPESVKKIWGWSEELLPKSHAREFNQAMMELGALICKPKSPNCHHCPLNTVCLAFKKNTAEQLPNRGPKTKKIDIKAAIAVIRKNGKLFIQKRPKSGLMAGLWEFPGGKIERETPVRALEREISEELNISIKNIRPLMQIKHAYTRFNVHLHCYVADFDKGKIRLKSAVAGKWVSPKSLKKFPFPAANVRLIKMLEKAGS